MNKFLRSSAFTLAFGYVVFGIADDITVFAQGAILASGNPAAIVDDERVLEAYLGRPEDEDFMEEALNA